MKPLAQINVIPFIDIMLVLLAIVLTTATFVAQGKIPVDLAEAHSGDPLPPTDKVELAIDEGGAVFFEDTAVTPDELTAQLAALATDTPILLRVDRDARFAHFVRVVDALKAHGLDDLSIVTRRADG